MEDLCIEVVFKAQVKVPLPPELIAEVRAEAAREPGFLGMQSELLDDLEITHSYWVDLAAVQRWAANPIHRKAKAQSSDFYSWVETQILEARPLPKGLLRGEA